MNSKFARFKYIMDNTGIGIIICLLIYLFIYLNC